MPPQGASRIIVSFRPWAEMTKTRLGVVRFQFHMPRAISARASYKMTFPATSGQICWLCKGMPKWDSGSWWLGTRQAYYASSARSTRSKPQPQ